MIKLPDATKLSLYIFGVISVLLTVLVPIFFGLKQLTVGLLLTAIIIDIWISIVILFVYERIIFIVNKKTLKDTVKYDIQNLAKILSYPFDDLSKEPDKNYELHAFYALRDKVGYKDNGTNWLLLQKEVGNDVDAFVKMLVDIEDFNRGDTPNDSTGCGILVHENGIEWSIKTKGKTKRGVPCNYTLTPIDEDKCTVYTGNISELLKKRWETFLRINIERLGMGYNPFSRMTQVTENGHSVKHT